MAAELAPLGLAPDHEVFEPHVTLARARNPRGNAALGHCANLLRTTNFGELPVREVTLFATQADRDGMRYEPISSNALAAAVR